jgi:predicted transcriptional regulator of viral defense system
MSEALVEGISRYRRYSLRDKGRIAQVSRGVYRLPSVGNPDLVAVSLRYPKAVLCFISALAFHKITIEIPSAVCIALPRKTREPQMEYPSLSVRRFSDKAYVEGIEEHVLDGSSFLECVCLINNNF